MRKKRGQITLFIIVGIVLLLIFGLLFYSKSIALKKNLQKQVTTTKSTYSSTERLNEYVSSCLDEASKQALFFIGLQGGNIFEYQNGTIKRESIKYLPLDYSNISTSVSYGILWNPKTPDFFPPNSNVILPFYPGQSLNLLAYYGSNNLSYLCQPNGPNQETSREGAERIKGETCLFPEGTKQGYGDNSIQEQMKLFIEKKLNECIDFSNVPEFSGKLVERGNYTVSVLLGAEDVIVSAAIPIKVSENGNLVTKQLSFSSSQKIRLKRIYEFAHDLVELDKKNVKFYKNNTNELVYALSSKYKPGFSVFISCPYCDYSNYTRDLGYFNDQVITITDSNSKLYGADYVFRFAVENRYPALDNIYTPTHTDKYDYIVGEGQLIYFEPFGYDPDENGLSYNYSGWKEDYDEEFDLLCCRGVGGSISSVDCMTSPEDCVSTIGNVFPKKWTTSEPYLENKKDASYQVEIKDLGPHVVKISTFDKEYSDWQDIRILVVDAPVAQADYHNNYSDVPRKNASIEDPYILDATKSSSILMPIFSYNWKDHTDGFSFDIGPILNLPGSFYTIETIKEGYFRNTLGTINTEPSTQQTTTSSNSLDFTNIQGYWKLDEASGKAIDSSGKGNDLTEKSDRMPISTKSGKINSARDFEKNDDEYFTISDSNQNGLDITSSLTIAAWVKFESLSDTQSIISKLKAEDPKRSYRLQFYHNTKRIDLDVSKDGTNAFITASSADNVIKDTVTWYHIVGVFNDATDTMQVYINGTASGSPKTFTGNIKNSDAAFQLGRYNDGEYFDGLLDEVIVWNKALTADEVRNIYENGLTEQATTTTAQNLQANIEGSGLRHDITLSVSNNIVNSEYEFSVMVYQCLNHKNANTTSYPYNNLPFDTYTDVEDPYMADHTCCLDSNTYAPTSKECYRYTEYGINSAFAYDFKSLPMTPSYSITYLDKNGIQIDPAIITSQDIFERTFSRNCSGARGNVCDGPIYETRKVVVSCGICSTPSQSLVKTFGEVSCINHEQDEYFPCNTTQKNCVSLGNDGYNTAGPLICSKAYCDGDGGDAVNCDLTKTEDCTCSLSCPGTDPQCYGKKPGDTFTNETVGIVFMCNNLCQAVLY